MSARKQWLIVLVSATLIVLCGQVATGAFRIWSSDRNTGVLPHEKLKEFFHWDLREFQDCKIPYSYWNGPPGMFPPTAWTQVDNAFDQWRSVIPAVIDFVRVPFPPGARPPLNRDKTNMIGWLDLEDLLGADWDGSYPDFPDYPERDRRDSTGRDSTDSLYAGTLALTSIWVDPGATKPGRILEADIAFNTKYRWVIGPFDLGRPRPKFADIWSVAAHEAGHFIGLDHDNFVHPGGRDATDGITPTLNPTVGPFDRSVYLRTLEKNDRDGCNFLYCPDLGDAPDPPYTTRVHTLMIRDSLNGVPRFRQGEGPEHLFGTKWRDLRPASFTYEWLGTDVDAECEANQGPVDPFDDGVFFPLQVVQGRFFLILALVNTARDPSGNFHDYFAPNGMPMFLNIWVDWNQNGVFQDAANEHIVGYGDPITPILPFNPPNTIPVFRLRIVPAGAMLGFTFMRVRLDWGEDCGNIAATKRDPTLRGAKGAAQFGEIEDYVIQIVQQMELFVDLGDLDRCNYPTLGVSDSTTGNPANLVTDMVWLGECVTPEDVPNSPDYDGCDDGVEFLGTPWYACASATIRVTVTAAPGFESLPVYFNFWKDGNLDGDFCDAHCSGAALEWAVQNAVVTAAGSPYFFTFPDPGDPSLGQINLVARARLTSTPVTGPVYGGLSECPDACWFPPALDSLGEVEDYVIGDAQLAVELGGAAAEAGDGYVTIRWSTASETMNDGFEILRDGALVAHVPSQGNGPSENHYAWTDGAVQNGVTYTYALVSVDINGVRETLRTLTATPTGSSGPATITEYALHQNYPNPFNPITHIAFDLVESGFVTLKVYNLMGQEVAAVVNGTMSQGRHNVSFNATNLSSGVYLYRLEVNGFAADKKMLLMK